MIQEFQILIDEYWKWLRDNTTLKQIDNWVEVTSPFIDRHNDYIQIYAKKENGNIILTDDAYTIRDLEISGCELATEKRQKILQLTLNGFGVSKEGDELIVKATENDFSKKKHNLIQAILAVNDLFYLAPASIVSLFLEDVREWLKENEIRYMENINIQGKSGNNHNFNFAIPETKSAPERLIRVMNRPQKSYAQSLAFTWIDVQPTRPNPDNTSLYAIINDTEKEIPESVLNPLQSIGANILPFSDREKYKYKLVS